MFTQLILRDNIYDFRVQQDDNYQVYLPVHRKFTKNSCERIDHFWEKIKLSHVRIQDESRE